MKRFMSLSMCLCAMLALLSACAGSSSKGDGTLIGKWEQVVEENGAQAVSTYDFKESGELVQTIVMKNDMPYINISGGGTCQYTYENDQITFMFSGADFDFDEFAIEGIDDENIDLAIEEMKSQLVDMEQTFTNVKIDGDKMTANFNGRSVTLTRL